MFREEEYFFIFKLRDVNFWIILLVFILYLIINIVNFYYKLSLNLLIISLYYIIYISNFIVFFLLYEIVFILIIFVIILLGYSYERLMASYLIMFYSFLFSSPTLIILILLDYVYLIKNWLHYYFFFNYFLIFSFIVKFPIFGFHYWLPVAHVEASTIGSMLLAGILLKLGSIGLVYIVKYINFIIKFHWLSFSILLVILRILFLRDLKIIIAYSSIAHISIVFYVIINGVNVGIKGRVIIIFYHGFLSPLIFWLVGLLAWWKTRSLIVIKFLRFSFLFIFIVFILIIMNIRFPPFLGFLREVYILKSFIIMKFVLIILVISVLFACYYNIYLFWCFNGVIGLIFKNSIYNLDVFLFILFVIFLNI